jgi:hypothetical protein
MMEDQSPCKSCSRILFPKCINTCKKLDMYQRSLIENNTNLNYCDMNIYEHRINLPVSTFRRPRD